MESKPVKVKLEDGTEFFMEYVPTTKGGEAGIKDKFKEIDFSVITKTVKGIGKSLKNATDFIEPDKTSVEFTITLAADTENSLMAKIGGNLSGEMGFKIAFEWEKDKKKIENKAEK